MLAKSIIIFLGYVWFPENIRERKKSIEENDFFIFGFLIKKHERKLNIIKIIKRFVYF